MRHIDLVANRDCNWYDTLIMLGKPIPPESRSLYREEAMAGRPPSGEAPPFSRRLAALRKDRGLTQQQLAEGLGVKLSLIAYYERRARNPSLEVAGKFAAFFDVPIATLVDEKHQHARTKRGPPSELELRLERLRRLPRTKQEMILAMLDAALAQADAR